jgi:uncharacterized protein with FMN-binding domain
VKKIALWFLSTVSVVVLLFGYHTSTQGRSAGSPPAVFSGNLAATPSPSASTTPKRPTRRASRTPGATPPTPTSTPTSTPTPTTKTATGDTASTQWGPVQVQLTVSGGSIEQVNVLQYPSGNGRDDQINSYALPILIQETLDSQSAQIDMVSGATVTSGGYLQSLQSAIDHAGLA